MKNIFQPNHVFETELVEAINPRRAGLVLLNGCMSPLWVQEVATFLESVGEDLRKLHDTAVVVHKNIDEHKGMYSPVSQPSGEIDLESVKLTMLVCSFPLVAPADLRAAIEFVKKGGTVLAAVHGVTVSDTMTRLRAALGLSTSTALGLDVPVQMIDCGIYFRPLNAVTQ